MDYWIESHQKLRGHPKTLRMTRRLRISQPCAVGYLHFLWWWAMDHAPDGDLRCYDAADLADAVGYDGDAEEFAAALVTSGFIDRTETGWELHDWHQYAGKLIDRRKADAERKRSERDARRAPAVEDGQPLTRTGDPLPGEVPPEKEGVPPLAPGVPPPVIVASNGHPPDVPATACVTSTSTGTGTDTSPDPRSDRLAAAATGEAAAAADNEASLHVVFAAWREATGRSPTQQVRRGMRDELRRGVSVDDVLYAVGELTERVERPLQYVRSVLRRMHGPSPGEQMELPVVAAVAAGEAQPAAPAGLAPPDDGDQERWQQVMAVAAGQLNPLSYAEIEGARLTATSGRTLVVESPVPRATAMQYGYILSRIASEVFGGRYQVRLEPRGPGDLVEVAS